MGSVEMPKEIWVVATVHSRYDEEHVDVISRRFAITEVRNDDGETMIVSIDPHEYTDRHVARLNWHWQDGEPV